VTTASGAGDAESLPERFFHEARRVLMKEADRLAFDAADILRIAQDAAMRAEFREMFRTEVNNPRLADIVIHYVESIASDLESRAAISDIKVDLIDRVGMAVVASVTVAAIGMVVVSGGALASVLLLTGALVGLAAAGTSRTWIKLDSHKRMFAAGKVRRLANGLEMKR
jgi:hypothetical protein